MRRYITVAGIITALIGGIAIGASMPATNAVQPITLSRAQMGGRIFTDYEPVVTRHGSDTTYDVELYRAVDEQFDMGMYRAGKSRYVIDEPYGVDEYMHFLTGSVTLTSSDGTKVVIGAGDSVVIPREWTGVWETEGYTKIYVIYNPDGPIE